MGTNASVQSLQVFVFGYDASGAVSVAGKVDEKWIIWWPVLKKKTSELIVQWRDEGVIDLITNWWYFAIHFPLVQYRGKWAELVHLQRGGLSFEEHNLFSYGYMESQKQK